MTRVARPSVLLWLTLWVSSAREDKVTLEVRYPQRTVTPARGSSVRLSCRAYYDSEQCGLLRAGWYNLTAPLTDPRKFLTTVNETVSDGNVRLRQVVTEILDLTPEDDGQFQCKAECASGETSMGHYIWITVQGLVIDHLTE